jgi:hypothetical protein
VHFLRIERCGVRTGPCRQEVQVFDGREPQWQLVLVQRYCEGHVQFDRPTEIERTQAALPRLTLAEALSEAIPDGVETALIRLAGFPRLVRALSAPPTTDPARHPV